MKITVLLGLVVTKLALGGAGDCQSLLQFLVKSADDTYYIYSRTLFEPANRRCSMKLFLNRAAEMYKHPISAQGAFFVDGNFPSCECVYDQSKSYLASAFGGGDEWIYDASTGIQFEFSFSSRMFYFQSQKNEFYLAFSYFAGRSDSLRYLALRLNKKPDFDNLKKLPAGYERPKNRIFKVQRSGNIIRFKNPDYTNSKEEIFRIMTEWGG